MKAEKVFLLLTAFLAAVFTALYPLVFFPDKLVFRRVLMDRSFCITCSIRALLWGGIYKGRKLKLAVLVLSEGGRT